MQVLLNVKNTDRTTSTLNAGSVVRWLCGFVVARRITVTLVTQEAPKLNHAKAKEHVN